MCQVGRMQRSVQCTGQQGRQRSRQTISVVGGGSCGRHAPGLVSSTPLCLALFVQSGVRADENCREILGEEGCECVNQMSQTYRKVQRRTGTVCDGAKSASRLSQPCLLRHGLKWQGAKLKGKQFRGPRKEPGVAWG